jgi:hypothetical protein
MVVDVLLVGFVNVGKAVTVDAGVELIKLSWILVCSIFKNIFLKKKYFLKLIIGYTSYCSDTGSRFVL